MAIKITILSDPILPDFGTYEYREMDRDMAKRVVAMSDVETAVPNKALADLLDDIYPGLKATVRKEPLRLVPADVALVIRPRGTLAEGAKLADLEKVGYSVGILRRIS